MLAPEAVQLAGLAISSGRSLFVFGPPGNGKTSLGRMLHAALKGDLWVPHCISVENDIIRFFDPHCHDFVAADAEHAFSFDQRWVRIRRPLIVVGGEVTLDSFDLMYSAALRDYEAPLHFKANGGTFLIDDYGRERIDPHQLLNRWITPLEHQIDYLTIRTGQKIKVPLRQTLIIATNLSPETVTDPAFLRRMGYRLYMGYANPEQYRKIFERYLAALGAYRSARYGRLAARAVQSRRPGAALLRAPRSPRAGGRYLAGCAKSLCISTRRFWTWLGRGISAISRISPKPVVRSP